MELRSRSRSKTPFLLTEGFLEGESYGEGGHTVVTRSSRKTTIRSTTSSRNNHVTHHHKVSGTAGITRKSLAATGKIHTSDYSSEEGEFDAHFSHLSENEKNQILEDAQRAANGNTEVSALSLYRSAGRYWDKYPKTDWTYSPHSLDRVEIAPGVVQMPNMSRPTIHSSTNTETWKEYEKSKLTARQRLFSSFMSNNNTAGEDEVDGGTDGDYEIRRFSSSYSSTRSFWQKITSVFVSIYSVIYWCCYTSYKTHNSALMWIAKKLHRFTSWLMLVDTWILRKNPQGQKKTGLIILLCLLPLLLIAGLHVLWSSGVSLAPFCHPHCGRYILNHYNSFTNAASDYYAKYRP